MIAQKIPEAEILPNCQQEKTQDTRLPPGYFRPPNFAKDAVWKDEIFSRITLFLHLIIQNFQL